MTVFGRDSLITSWMALLVDPDLALGVLQTLARFQGKDIDPRSEEQPGRILHEMRFGEAPSLSLGGGNIYYGTADATPAVRHAARRAAPLGPGPRGGGRAPAQRRAGPRVDRELRRRRRRRVRRVPAGHRPGSRQPRLEGLLGRHPLSPTARVAQAPIALCEVQAYVYSAYLARAHFAREAGDEATFERYRAKATRLKTDFNRDFWLEDNGLVRRRPRCRQAADRLAHLQHRPLPVDRDRRRRQGPHRRRQAAVARDVQRVGRADPGHVDGRLQPHQLPLRIGVAPRHRHRGRRAVPLRVHDDHASGSSPRCSTRPCSLGGRLPELFSGLDRSEFSAPVGYPTSCSPQAWAAASPLLCLRTMLRLDPWVPYGKTWLAPRAAARACTT